ncbi:MAG: ParB/RepB/Spo0J family partition protein, partial [Nitrososphaerales archaeon]
MLIDLPLDNIETNPFNPRINFIGLRDLVSSFKTNGQLSPIRVRQSARNKDKYQLIFGHRRVMAAKKLGWKTIRAEVVSVSDQKMAIESLAENLDRKDLSDYEKGLMFDRIKNEFGISFAEIGRVLEISRQHVSNYAAMLNLFSPEKLSANPELLEFLFKITEHHSRILLTI